MACAEELAQLFPDKPRHPGSGIMTRLISRFLFSREYFDDISRNFQSVVSALGEFVSGDEKLDHFTGNSGHIRKVPNKPARIGLWHYQLVGLLDTDKPYLLDASTSCPNTSVGESDYMAEVVGRWAGIVKRLNRYSPRLQTTITFGAYYTDNNTRTGLLQNEMKFSGAVKTGRFKALVNEVKHLVTKPGDFGSLYNPSTNELFTLCWDENPNLGQKWFLPMPFTISKAVAIPALMFRATLLTESCLADATASISTSRVACGPSNEAAFKPSAIGLKRTTLFSRPPC